MRPAHAQRMRRQRMQPIYTAPDFSQEPFANAPDARFAPAPADGVLPRDFFASTHLPTWVKVGGRWLLPRHPRMDAAIVQDPEGSLLVLEARHVTAGQPVVVGFTEDGTQGVFVHATGFSAGPGSPDDLRFVRSDVGRDAPVDYARLARLIRAQRDRGGHIVWVVGHAVLHARGRDLLTWFVDNGYVGALLGGNAIGVHDIEQALMGTTLGLDRAGRPVTGGHAFPMRAINQIAAAGSIHAAVEQGVLTEGVMHACVTRHVPVVLAGSIRDDGPLPDTVTDILVAQERMREHARRATMAIMIATAIHSIGFGHMLPSCVAEPDGSLRPLVTVAVDSSERVIRKLQDRTRLAFGINTSAEDFLHVLRHFVEHDAEAGIDPDALDQLAEQPA